MTKGAMLNVTQTERDFLYRREQMSLAEGEADAISTPPRCSRPSAIDDLLYARVDLVATIQGWLVMELELVEPSLFLTFHEPAADALANGIRRRLSDR